MECNLCKMNENWFWIKEYKYWNLGVGTYQHTLGSLMIVLKKHKEMFSEMKQEEIIELLDAVKTAQKILDLELKPDWYNIQQNGNWEHHLHINVIPRYREKRKFFGRVFVDRTFGQPVIYNPKQEDRDFLKSMTETLKTRMKM